MWCGHYNEWLAYSLDQQAKASQPLVDRCQSQAMEELAKGGDRTILGAKRSLFNNWAAIAVRHGVDTGRWPDFDAIPSGEGNLIGRFDLTYGQLIAARQDPEKAAAALLKLRDYRDRIRQAMPVESPDDHESAAWLDRAVDQGVAVVALARGDREEGVKLLLASAEAEAALPQPFGPPILAKPSAELLGDEYLAMERKDEAASAYRRALATMPGRQLSLSGLAKLR
jgi:hypothetical protein